jgi:hypothetical protein
MNNVIQFPGDNPAAGGGGGPEDPMLEQRVGRLEEKVDRIEAILVRLEPKIMEVLHTGAKQAELNKVQLDVAELKSSAAKQIDLNKIQVQIAEILAGGAKQADLYKAQVELAEVKGRVAGLPTWWMLITAIITTWCAGFAIANYSLPKAAVSVEKSAEKAATK